MYFVKELITEIISIKGISLVLLVKKFSKRDLIGGIITIKNIFFY